MSGASRQDLLHVGIPKLLNGAATLGISLYSVRVLEPAAFGVLSFCTNCLVLFDALLGSALDLGVARWVTGKDTRPPRAISGVEKAAVYLKIAAGIVLALTALFAGDALGARLFGSIGGRKIFVILAVAGSAMLMLRSLQVYFQMRLAFRAYGTTDLVHSTLRIVLVATVMASGHPTPPAILACFAAAPLLAMALFAPRLRAALAWKSVSVRRTDFADVARASTPALATFGVSSIVARMDLLVLALRTGPVQLGIYGAGLTIATIPEILGAYLAPALLPRILPACRAGEMLRLFRRFHAIAFSSCALAAAAGFVLAGPVLSRLLPGRFAVSLDVARILLPGTLAMASVFPLTLNFLMLKRPRAFLSIDLIATPFLVAAYLMVPRAGAAVAAAWVTSAFRIGKSCMAQFIAYRAARAESKGASLPAAQSASVHP